MYRVIPETPMYRVNPETPIYRVIPETPIRRVIPETPKGLSGIFKTSLDRRPGAIRHHIAEIADKCRRTFPDDMIDQFYCGNCLRQHFFEGFDRDRGVSAGFDIGIVVGPLLRVGE